MIKGNSKRNIALMVGISILLIGLFAYFFLGLNKNNPIEKKSETGKIAEERVEEFKNIGLDEIKNLQPSLKIGEVVKNTISNSPLTSKKYNWKKDITLVLSEDIPEDFALENNLPEDPGEGGDKLVLGVDNNANMVMDDLERVIEYNFRDEPELRAIYLARSVAFYRDLQNSMAENFSIKNLEKNNRDIMDFVICNTFYSREKGKKSYVSQFSKLMVYPNMERKNISDEIEVRANRYEIDQMMEGVLSGTRIPQKTIGEASEEYCRNFVSQYGFSF